MFINSGLYVQTFDPVKWNMCRKQRKVYPINLLIVQGHVVFSRVLETVTGLNRIATFSKVWNATIKSILHVAEWVLRRPSVPLGDTPPGWRSIVHYSVAETKRNMEQIPRQLFCGFLAFCPRKADWDANGHRRARLVRHHASRWYNASMHNEFYFPRFYNPCRRDYSPQILQRKNIWIK